MSGVVTDARPKDAATWTFPTTCPCSNQSPLHRPEGEANYYCTHGACPWQVRRRLEHFIARDAMDMTGWARRLSVSSWRPDCLTTIADIYDLPEEQEQILALDRWAPKSLEKLLAGLETSKQQPFERVLYALGIRFVGEGVAQGAGQGFPTVDALAAATQRRPSPPSMRSANGSRPSITEFFADETERAIVDRLRAAGLQFEQEATDAAGDQFVGMTFVLTGERPA